VSAPTPATCLAVGIARRRVASSMCTFAFTLASAPTPATCLAVGIARRRFNTSRGTCACTLRSAPTPATRLAVGMARKRMLTSRCTCACTLASAHTPATLQAAVMPPRTAPPCSGTGAASTLRCSDGLVHARTLHKSNSRYNMHVINTSCLTKNTLHPHSMP
jgi:hypothetical protein